MPVYPVCCFGVSLGGFAGGDRVIALRPEIIPGVRANRQMNEGMGRNITSRSGGARRGAECIKSL
jgi:hypothetical protein